MPKKPRLNPVQTKQAIRRLASLFRRLTGDRSLDVYTSSDIVQWEDTEAVTAFLQNMNLPPITWTMYMQAHYAMGGSPELAAARAVVDRQVNATRNAKLRVAADNRARLLGALVAAQDDIIFGKVNRRNYEGFFKRLKAAWSKLVVPLPTRVPFRTAEADAADAVVNGGSPRHGGVTLTSYASDIFGTYASSPTPN